MMIINPFIFKRWTPLELADLILYLDTTDNDVITKDINDRVSLNLDKSPAGYDGFQGNPANAPQSGLRNLGSKNAFDYNLSHCFIDIPDAFGNLFNSGAFTYVVSAQTDDPTASQHFFRGLTGNTGNTRVAFGITGAGTTLQVQNGTTGTTLPWTADTSPHIFAFRKIIGTGMQVFVDGVLLGTVTASNTQVPNIAIGGRGNGGPANNWNGLIGNNYMVARDITDTELNNLIGFEASERGLTVATI